MKRRLLAVVNFALLLSVLVSTAACGSESGGSFYRERANPASTSGSPEYSAHKAEPERDGIRSLSEEKSPAEGERLAGEAPAADEAPPAVTGFTRDASDVSGISSSTAGDTYNSSTSNTGKPAPPPDVQQQYQSPLTAGQVDDNAKFQEYLDYLNSYQGPAVLPIDVSRRLFVRVVDGQQHPVAGARVQLFDGDRRAFDVQTMSDGRALFFPGAAGAGQGRQFRAVVTRGQYKAEATLQANTLDQTVALTDMADNTGPVGLDIVFLLDATGSMGDELAQIKATVDGVAARIEQLPGSSKPRFGLVAYRDQGDEYVTRSWDFSDVQQFSANLSNVEANNGGDYPESVNAGLHDAIHLSGWADNSIGRHLRMIVLVGDAPPHLDYPNDYEYTDLLEEAVTAGIKILPIGASGLTDQGEYIFRQFAQVTQGKFVFLTYANGVSGAPGASTTHHVSDFTVDNLDSLVVNLVAQEVANQTGERKQSYNSVPVTASLTPQAPPRGWASLLFLTGLGFLAPGIQWLYDMVVGNLGWSVAFWLLVLTLVVAGPRNRFLRARLAPAQLDILADEIDDTPDEAGYLPAGVAYEEDLAAPVPAFWTMQGVYPTEIPANVRPTDQRTVPLPNLPSNVVVVGGNNM